MFDRPVNVRYFCGVLVLTAALSALAACGGGGGGNSTSSATGSGGSSSSSTSLSSTSASSGPGGVAGGSGGGSGQASGGASSGSSSSSSSSSVAQVCPPTDVAPLNFDAVYVIAPSSSGGPGQVSPFTPGVTKSVGVLNPLAPIATGTRPTSAVTHPDGLYLYVVNAGDATVQAYTIDDSGELETEGAAAPFATAGASIQEAAATVHPNGCYLYVTQAPPMGSSATPTGAPLIAQMTLDGNGVPALFNATPTVTLPAPPNGALAIEPTGQFAYVPVVDPQAGGEVCELLIGTNGVLTLAPNGCMSVPEIPIEVTVSADGASVYVLSACLSATGCQGQAAQYAIGSSGVLTATGGALSVTNPVQLALSPDGVFGDFFTATTQTAFTASCALCDSSCTAGLSACTPLASGGDLPYALSAGAFGSKGGYAVSPVAPPVGAALLESLPVADYSAIAGAVTANGIYALFNSPQTGAYLTHLYGAADTFSCLVTPVGLPAPAPTAIAVLPGTPSSSSQAPGPSCAPSVPSGLKASSTAVGQASVSFAGSTSPTGSAVQYYNVYRNGKLVETTTASSFTDTGLTGGSTYSYSIAAVDPYGATSPQSAAVSVKTIASDTLTMVPGEGASFGSYYGYGVNIPSAGTFGTLTPSTLTGGTTVQGFYDNGGPTAPAGSPAASIIIGGFGADPTQAWLISASADNPSGALGPVTMAGSSAIYTYSNGTATWAFGSLFGLCTGISDDNNLSCANGGAFPGDNATVTLVHH